MNRASAEHAPGRRGPRPPRPRRRCEPAIVGLCALFSEIAAGATFVGLAKLANRDWVSGWRVRGAAR